MPVSWLSLLGAAIIIVGLLVMLVLKDKAKQQVVEAEGVTEQTSSTAPCLKVDFPL